MSLFFLQTAEYPYINYYVINKPQAASEEFFRASRSRAYDILNPGRVGYRCHHSIDLFEEAVSIARPPVEPLSKKPVGENTGYIVCVYQVFNGDDGEKFERNWLFWTGKHRVTLKNVFKNTIKPFHVSGARMLYKNLPKAVGLRRITLHKSCSQSSHAKVTYLLLVECSEFMGHIGEAANLLPILRGRICGYTGIYRVASSFWPGSPLLSVSKSLVGPKDLPSALDSRTEERQDDSDENNRSTGYRNKSGPNSPSQAGSHYHLTGQSQGALEAGQHGWRPSKPVEPVQTLPSPSSAMSSFFTSLFKASNSDDWHCR